MPSAADVKTLAELGALTLCALCFVGLAIWREVRLSPIIENNTKAINTLTATVSALPEQTKVLNELNGKVATQKDLVRIHDRIDETGKDVSVIMGKLGC